MLAIKLVVFSLSLTHKRTHSPSLSMKLGVEDGDLRVGSASGSVFMRGGNGLFVTGDHINISSGHNLELLTTYTVTSTTSFTSFLNP